MTGFLAASAAAAGAAVMVVEIMGSRVIGPFFGASLFVWTALITVTLAALGLGYAAGGVLADRKGTPDVLYVVLALAGGFALLVPVLKAPVIRLCAPLGLRLGAFTAALQLFGPCLFLLGCASPLFVRIATRELPRLGRTVGLFYAASTLGGVVGSLATGFFLIERLGVRGVFALAGGVLLGLAALYFAVVRRRLLAALLALAPLFVPAAPERASRVLPGGGTVERLVRREGFYGTLQVLEYRWGTVRVRDLVLDGLAQSGMDTASGLSVYEYVYFMEFLPYAMRPGGRSCLAIGLGAGLIPRWYDAHGIRTDVVDLSPEVVRLAREHFGFRTSGEVVVADARRFLATPGRTYDYAVVDAFNGDAAASHLLSLEALRLLRSRLEPGGIAAINLIGGVGDDAEATASVVRTLREVFESVELFPAFEPGPGAFGNVIAIAHDGLPVPFDAARVAQEPVHMYARGAVDRFLGQRVELPAGARARLLRDDHNPLDALELWSKEGLRRRILSAVHWDMLL